MTNIEAQEPRNLRSNSLSFNLAIKASDPERVLRGTDDLCFYTSFENPQNTVLEPAVTLKATLESNEKRPSSRNRPAPDMSPSFPELLDHSPLRAIIKKQNKLKRGA